MILHTATDQFDMLLSAAIGTREQYEDTEVEEDRILSSDENAQLRGMVEFNRLLENALVSKRGSNRKGVFFNLNHLATLVIRRIEAQAPEGNFLIGARQACRDFIEYAEQD